MALDVICAGAATLDRIAIVDRIPGVDERIVAERFVVAGGGPAATAAVTLARLGARVGFAGVVGDDAAGRLVREQLEFEGVDTRWLELRDGIRTTESVILVERDSGARTIITTPSSVPDPARIPIADSAWLHVDQAGYASAGGALASGSLRLSVDGGNPVPGLDLEHVDLYAPTVSALAAAFPAESSVASALAARAAGARRVVVTDGAAGTHVLLDGELETVAAFDVAAVSTLGAGDVFHGALLAGLVEGRELIDATRRANAVAALSCRALDGRSGIPDADETQIFLDARLRAAGGMQ